MMEIPKVLKSPGQNQKKEVKMKVTAITKFKNGILWEMLKKLGWTQSELGRRSGISAQTIGDYLNLKNKPSPLQIDKIQKAFGEAGEFLDCSAIWPENFVGLKKSLVVEQTREVELLAGNMDTFALHDSDKPDFETSRQLIEESLNKLPPKYAIAIRKRFFDGELVSHTAKEKGVTRSREHQIIKDGLRKLRIGPLAKLRVARECIL